MKYLFKALETIRKSLKGKELFILTDFDGTLAAIAKTPDQAVLPVDARILLKELSEIPQCKIAVVSGRELKDLKKLVKIPGLIYVGNHGLEMEGPKLRIHKRVSAQQQRELQKMFRLLDERLKHIPGVVIQNKKLTLSVHYRLVKETRIHDVRQIVREISVLPAWKEQFLVRKGKLVYEIVPNIGWNKGKAVLWLLAQKLFTMKNIDDLVPIYLGDDVSDEDVFVCLKKDGLTVFVGASNHFSSHYYVKNPDEAIEFLRIIHDLLSEGKDARYQKNRIAGQ